MLPTSIGSKREFPGNVISEVEYIRGVQER
jgi:hypothetical protein